MTWSFRPLVCGALLVAMIAGLPLSSAQASVARHSRWTAPAVNAATRDRADAQVSGSVGGYVIPNSAKPQDEWTCSYDPMSLRWINFGMPKSVQPQVAMRSYWHRRGWPAQNVALYVLYQGKRGSIWRTWKYTELIKEVYYGKGRQPRLTTFVGHGVRSRSQVTDKWWSRNASSYRVEVELVWLRPTHGSPAEGTVKEIISHYRSGEVSLTHNSTCPRQIATPPVMAWGDNTDGALGDGKGVSGSSAVPVTVSGLTGVAKIGAGGSNGYAVVGGAAYAWGTNESGELGDGKSAGTQGNSDVPVKVAVPGTVTAVTGGEAGNGYALASGHVYAWGDNSDGQLGNGSTGGPAATTPVQVSGLSDIVQIAAGSGTAYARTSTGAVYAWGDNTFGQLGEDPTVNPTQSNVPVQVSGLSGVTSIAAGGTAAYALVGSAVSAWGNNAAGQLGDGSDPATEPYMFTPVSVLGGSSVTALAAGANDGYALTLSGVLAWGDDSDGELGDGGTAGSQSSTPMPVNELSDATAIAAGSKDGYAVTSAGTVVAWGSNSDGALGDGNDSSTEPRSFTPVEVSGLSHVTALVAGDLNAYAMRTS
jgi:alpha-tubulin suppressor-like RCC1 family protein